MQEIEHLPLLLGVLNRAAMDVANGLMCNTREKREALWWITDWEYCDNPAPFSYPWICEHLNLDPARTRDIILHFSRTYRGTHQKGKKRSFATGRGHSMTRAIEAIFEAPNDGLGHIVIHLYR